MLSQKQFDTVSRKQYTRKFSLVLKDIPIYWKISFFITSLVISFFILQGWFKGSATIGGNNIFQFQQLISTAKQLQLQTHIGEAHKLYVKALPLAKSSLDSSHTLNQLGATFNAQHDHKSSLHTYRMAEGKLNKQRSSKSTQHWYEAAINAKGLGDTYLAMDRLDSAIWYYQKASDIHRTYLISASQSTMNFLAKLWHQMGEAYMRQSKPDIAHSAYEKALGIWDSLTNISEKYLAEEAKTTASLGLLFAVENNFDQAEQMLRSTYKTYRSLSQKDPASYRAHLAETLTQMGELYRGYGMFEAAIASFEEAERIYQALVEKEPGVYLIPLANVLNHKAFCHQQIVQYSSAETSYQHSIAVLNQHPSPSLEMQYRLYSDLVVLYEIMIEQQLPLDYQQQLHPLILVLDTLETKLTQEVISVQSNEQNTLPIPAQ